MIHSTVLPNELKLFNSTKRTLTVIDPIKVLLICQICRGVWFTIAYVGAPCIALEQLITVF